MFVERQALASDVQRQIDCVEVFPREAQGILGKATAARVTSRGGRAHILFCDLGGDEGRGGFPAELQDPPSS